MNASQLQEIEAAMKAEHQKDLDAFQRLMRFVPAHEAPLAIQNANGKDLVKSVAASDEGVPALTELDKRILDVMRSRPTDEWTVRDLIRSLSDRGYKLQSGRPESTINRSLRRLVSNALISLIHGPIGRRPGSYKVTDKAIDQGSSVEAVAIDGWSNPDKERVTD